MRRSMIALSPQTVSRHVVLFMVTVAILCGLAPAQAEDRLRMIIETDAGGDPDDEQSLVRFLLYVNEWDVEGIIANRREARPGENRNPERTGLGIVRRLLKAYGECHTHLVQNDARYPTPELLWRRTVAGYDDTDEAVKLIITAVDKPDARVVWYSDWGTDVGGATNNLRRALDRVLRERGAEGYKRFKSRLRLSSADAFGEHTLKIEPAFPLWVDTFRPPMDGKRWYHRFSGITARAGGFDLAKDCLTGHGPLGACYPTNTTHGQKEGDTMTFLYLVPTGISDPEQPAWGSWAGRYGPNETLSGRPYFWANQRDAWSGATNRDNTLSRWAADLQNDFKARLDWCVKSFAEANHAPVAVVNGQTNKSIRHLDVAAGMPVRLSAHGSADPDGNRLAYEWMVYPEAGSYTREVQLENAWSAQAILHVPPDATDKTIHVILTVRDDGDPPLAAYRRIIVRGRSPQNKI
jgi:Cellulose-binding Sde182, nucleoside hydrolase-like domain/Cellulose-binding protein Sde0182, C-terminal domain